MKDCTSVGRSHKKSDGRTKTKHSNGSPNKSNGTANTKSGGSASRDSPKSKAKESPEMRPRRRASQTYFFKYQLARNPLRAEEEDLKLALLASLERCYNGTPDNKKKHCDKSSSSEKKIKLTPTKNSIQPPSNKTTTNKGEETPPLQTNSEQFDEDYLQKYKPETEDFLTFICFRTTAPRKTNGFEDTAGSNNNNSNNNNNKLVDKHDSQNLNKYTSSLNNNSSSNKMTNNNNRSIIDFSSPNNNRRPTRQSPRLANSNRKISENTAYDNSITYEEDMKRASIALEDMAQEVISSDGINNEVAQNAPDCISKSSSSPYKNNKHLVKGLMTREFAGAFADEETIFESISNHKL